MRILLLILCLFTTPAFAQVFYPQSTTLANGLRVVVLPQHRAPVVMHMVWYQVGAMDDPAGKSGLAHFLEHLMFKGTAKYPEGTYSSTIARLGGENNAFTTHDFTAFYAKVGREHLGDVMAMEADRMTNLVFNPQQVLTENSVIVKERGQRVEDDMMSRFAEQIQAAQFLPHPYGRPVIGWLNEMSAFSAADAQNFYNTWYAPNNAILVIAGDITLKEVRPLLAQTFAKVPRKTVPQRVASILQPKLGQTHMLLQDKDISQAVYQQIYTVPAATPKTLLQSDATMVLADILGDGRTGLLQDMLVKRLKLASSAQAYYDPMARGGLTSFIIVAVPQQGVSEAQLAAAIKVTWHQALPALLTPANIARHTHKLNLAAIFARDSLDGPAMQVGQALSQGLSLKAIEAWPARMKAVTAPAVMQAYTALSVQTPLITFAEPENREVAK